MKLNKKLLAALSLTVTTLSVVTFLNLKASDHDDGEMEQKGRNLNLTDLYVFREDWQDAGAINGNQNLILVMNTNPRSLARQQYFFSTKARYEFHVSRVAAGSKRQKPTGSDDVTLRFEFGEPDKTSGRQSMKLTTIKDGTIQTQVLGNTNLLTDNITGTGAFPSATFGNHTITAFAGLREDSFFFDVERYFRIRGLLAGLGNTLGSSPIQGGANVFRSNETAVDFTTGYNVNSIVVRVPIAYLQSAAQEPVFDVWQTISIKQ